MIVVIIIIGVLASLAIPRYNISIERARAGEGVQLLDAIRKAQLARMTEFGAYGKNTKDLNITFPAPKYFDAIDNNSIDSKANNLGTVDRSSGDYTLSIAEDGALTCTGATCGSLGL